MLRGHFKSPLSPHLQHRRILHRLAGRRYYAKHYALGLTARGTVRKLNSYPQFWHLHGNERRNARRRFNTKLLNDQGLSARRKPIKPIMSEQERAWRQLRATMVLNMPEMLTPLERSE